MPAILCLNAGSSSVKFSIYSREHHPRLLVIGAVSGLTAERQSIDYKSFSSDGTVIESIQDQQVDCPDHDAAFKLFLDHLESRAGERRVLKSVDDIGVTCHRIVHGGANPKPLVITKNVYDELDILSDLAPLHNQRALDIVHSCITTLKHTKNIAFFDSSFHTTIPEHVYTYPMDIETQRRNKIRKYGFHGLSYAYITSETAAFLGRDVTDLNIIALHLGSGASACAIKKGKSINTSMGLTPLEGLPGATRSGSIDPSLIFHYVADSSNLLTSSTRDVHLTVAEDILNRHSGWSAITGTTDFGLITQRAQQGDHDAKLAFDIFVDRVSSFVGSYFVALKGQVDALVFAGGIGEKGAGLREAVIENVGCLGLALDTKLNTSVSKSSEKAVIISKDNAKIKILVVQTDEQLQMAKEVIAGEF
ncbi:Acetokinase family-domain-containing protein [Lipomyces japonicus]|uniref:Acetokinase family-domain-containing protein n=1 Tax=Lipomyces japonicus TaxID=56871 RepID=UPI0034CF5E22